MSFKLTIVFITYLKFSLLLILHNFSIVPIFILKYFDNAFIVTVLSFYWKLF
jgi:hypothetical protein